MPVFSGRVDVIRTIPPDMVFDVDGGIPARVWLDGDSADISAGGRGVDGDLRLRTGLNVITVHLDGNSGTAFFGGNGQGGDIFLFRDTATDINDVAQASIHIDGQAGDIKLRNADFAEEFEIEDSELHAVTPGSVMVMTDTVGRLRLSHEPYDRRVAGVVSGADGLKPAIILDHKRGTPGQRKAVALAGKVYCKVDAEYSPVAIGDLLTTSSTPGHAMKASDASLAFGSVIGKALRAKEAGRGLIPILVSLQ